MPARYAFIWILVLVVLIAGLAGPKLMDTDAPEYAGVAMRMYQTGNWREMINRSYENGAPFDYLEKPHLIYWSALPGYALLGIHDYAYRLLSVLLTIAAAFAVGKVARMLYHKEAGATAAILFVTAQAILLASHDVRTDSLLTSFCMLAIAQLLHFILRKKSYSLLLAGLFLACAVASKGMIALLVCGSTIGCYLVAKRDWRSLFDWRWLLVLLSFGICLSPVLYCYYVQFDLHPEKLVNGKYGVSGIKHLLWSQSFERFSGTGDFNRESPEFIFFFHTLLWALLPWSMLCYGGVARRLKDLWVTRGRSFFREEQLSFAGVWLMFILMSLSKIKLPHYINVLFPLLCVFIAGYLHQLQKQGKERVLLGYARFQVVLCGLLIVVALALNIWAFPVQQYAIVVAMLLLLVVAVAGFRKLKPSLVERVWVPSALVALLLHFLLNTNFYPRLDQYQGGSAMAMRIKEQHYNKADVFLYGYVSRSFDFYLGQWSPMLSDDAIREKKNAGQDVLLFVDQKNLDRLKASFRYTVLESLPSFHITALDLNFLNPATREASCDRVYLVRVVAPGS